MIKGGPTQSTLLIKEKTEKIDKEKDKTESAERRWQYIQNHAITNIQVLFPLKSSVGHE